MKLNLRAFALTCGIFWGLGIFLLTWWIIAFNGPTGQPTLLGQVYRGYNVSAPGSIIGLIYGFVDGLVGGGVFAWLYNKIVGSSESPKR